jgi:hypothetical protein
VELIDMIVDYMIESHREEIENFHWSFTDPPVKLDDFSPFQVAKYATITRDFQYAVEQRTLNSLQVNMSEFSQLNAMVVDNPRRVSYLKTLAVSIDLPKVDEL